MKIAISGKGGVGKSTLAAAISLLLAKQGKNVLALDADPDANLAAALGCTIEDQKEIIPLSEQKALIEERTGAKVKAYGQMFKLNPKVDDIAKDYATIINDVSLLVLGAVEQGGGGCACPESVLIKALVMDLILHKDEVLVMDMEAGVEHLGRSTAKGVDTMIIVVEPGQRSIDCANRIIRMCKEIGLNKIKIVANKVESIEDRNFINESLQDYDIIGFIPMTSDIRKLDRDGMSLIQNGSKELLLEFENILKELV